MTSTSNNDQPVVLMVGGWSPGPLEYLQLILLEDGDHILQPSKLPMPPFGCSWCCHPKVAFMLGVLGVLLWFSFRRNAIIVWNLLALLAAAIWGRLLIAVVVRTSIQTGVDSCMEAIRWYNNESGRTNKVVLLGFSWGGAVLSELLAQGKLGDQPPPCLLIAPTTSLVASISFQKDSALRINLETQDEQYHVVHGTRDGAFCPHQERWNQSRGIRFHRVRDNHIFMGSQSQQLLTNLLGQVLDAARRQ